MTTTILAVFQIYQFNRRGKNLKRSNLDRDALRKIERNSIDTTLVLILYTGVSESDNSNFHLIKPLYLTTTYL